MQVRDAVVRAGRTVATVFDRPELAARGGDGQVAPPSGRVDASGPGDPRRLHAVEGVAAVRDTGEQVLRLADPEQVSGLVLRKLIHHPGDDLAEPLLLDGAADTEAIEVQRGEAGGGLAP